MVQQRVISIFYLIFSTFSLPCTEHRATAQLEVHKGVDRKVACSIQLRVSICLPDMIDFWHRPLESDTYNKHK